MPWSENKKTFMMMIIHSVFSTKNNDNKLLHHDDLNNNDVEKGAPNWLVYTLINDEWPVLVFWGSDRILYSHTPTSSMQEIWSTSISTIDTVYTIKARRTHFWLIYYLFFFQLMLPCFYSVKFQCHDTVDNFLYTDEVITCPTSYHQYNLLWCFTNIS